jgi:hypothetical protein
VTKVDVARKFNPCAVTGGGEGLALALGERDALGERLALGLGLLLGEIEGETEGLTLALSDAEGEAEALGLIEGEPMIATPPPKSSASMSALPAMIWSCKPICPGAL